MEAIPDSIPLGALGRGLRENDFASGMVAGVELGKQRLRISGGVLRKKRNMRQAVHLRNGVVSEDADNAPLSACAAHDPF